MISVLVCTYNRAELLRLALDSFVAQEGPDLPFEVVVVDDGSTDHTREVVESFRGKMPLRYSRQSNSGVASARNHALLLARGSLVLFHDDDDIASPRLLSEHVSTHNLHAEPWTAVLGYTGLAPEIRNAPLMHYVTEVGCFLFSYPGLEHGQILDFRHFWGGRISCKRSFLLDHGAFNPIFAFGYEDIELGFRLGLHGLRVVYNQRAVSATIRPIAYDHFCYRNYLQGLSSAVFSRLHPLPEIRSYTGVEEARQAWPGLKGRVDEIVERGRNLDRTARSDRDAGLPLGRDDAVLHRAYEQAFVTSRVRGIVEALADPDQTP
jgi:glycosyltransferase involved in cell wall biosynthesis